MGKHCKAYSIIISDFNKNGRKWEVRVYKGCRGKSYKIFQQVLSCRYVSHVKFLRYALASFPSLHSLCDWSEGSGVEQHSNTKQDITGTPRRLQQCPYCEYKSRPLCDERHSEVTSPRLKNNILYV